MLRNRQPPPGRQFPPAPARSGVLVRDAVFNMLSPLSPSIYLTARKVGMPTLQPDQLPALSVFELGEDAPSLGLPNMGPIDFKNDTTIAISVARGFEDPIYLQGGLEQDVAFVKNLLLTTATFTRRWYGALFESIPSYKVRWVYAAEGEAYFGELRLEMVFRFPEVFVPAITDTLSEVDVNVAYDPASGLNLKAKYELWQRNNGVTL